jgi:hypothetical protein
MLRIPHCIDNRLTDGGKAVSPTHRPRSSPQKLFVCLQYSFLLEAENTPGTIATGRFRSIEKKFIDFVGSRTRDLPACNIAS